MAGPVVGIDTMRWGGPVRAVERLDDLKIVDDLSSIDLETGELSHKKVVGRIPGGGTMWLYYEGTRITSARIEASLPKVLTGSNFTLLSLRDALPVMERLDAKAGRYVEWADPFDGRHIYRADAASHFSGVTHRDHLLRGLATAPGYPQRSAVRHDRQRGGAMSLTRGPTGRSGCLYDKQGETLSRSRRARSPRTREAAQRELAITKDVLRYELRLRSSALTKIGITTVATLALEPLAAAHQSCFHEFGFGLEVAGMNEVVHKALHADSKLTGHDRLMTLGVSLAEFYNEVVPLSEESRRKYRGLQRALGIAPSDFASVAPVVRLDYDTGAQVLSDGGVRGVG